MSLFDRSPALGSLLLAAGIFTATCIVGVVIGMIIIFTDTGGCDGPCDAAVQAAGDAWLISFWAGLLLAAISAVVAYISNRKRAANPPDANGEPQEPRT